MLVIKTELGNFGHPKDLLHYMKTECITKVHVKVQYCFEDVFEKDMGMGDAPALPLRVSLGVEILPVSAVQRGKEEQPQPGPGVDARPFAGNAQPHADPAGPQGEPGLL